MSELEQDANWKAGYLYGKLYERQRIIKLLEDTDVLWNFRGCGCCSEADFVDLVALIKGENK